MQTYDIMANDTYSGLKNLMTCLDLHKDDQNMDKLLFQELANQAKKNKENKIKSIIGRKSILI